MVEKVFPYTVDNKVQKFVLFVEEQGHRQIPNLLFGVLVGRDEIDSFEMAKIDVPAEDVDIQ